MEIENRLRRALDVACNEDQVRNRKGHCADNLALLRKLALNLARLEASKGSMRVKLKRAGWDDGLSRQHLIPIHQNPYAIALTGTGGILNINWH